MNILTKTLEKIGLKGTNTPSPNNEHLNNYMPRDTMSFVNKAVEGEDGIFKAYIPEFLYKPPYGMPRKVATPYLKKLAKNPYIFSVIKSLSDGVSNCKWHIKVKEEFQDNDVDYSELINEVTKFFRNPNGNEESFNHILRCVVTDICECDSAVIIKVFNRAGEFKQIFARDGSLFLMNPDIYGYLGDRADFVQPIDNEMLNTDPTTGDSKLINQYNTLYREQAGFFQYGWTAGSMPIPFGKREVVYIMQNPRSDSIYGRSPIEILDEVIRNLLYGVQMGLDFYQNNNVPDGIISLMGANRDQIEQFRENMNNQIMFKDDFGFMRKRFNKIPVTSTQVDFKPFQITAKDMEMITSQKWFTKILWSCFGVTADDMGYTEDSSKNVSAGMVDVSKRKALKPILSTIQYHINTQIVPEFFSTGAEMASFSDVPIEFCFDEYEFTEDKQKHDILEQQIRMGIKTPEMVAKELGIDVEELKESKREERELESMQNNLQGSFTNNVTEEEKEPEEAVVYEKAKPSVEQEIKEYIDNIEVALLSAVGGIDEGRN